MRTVREASIKTRLAAILAAVSALLAAPGGAPALLFCGMAATAEAQFKVTAPAPYTPAVARQKIKALLGKLDPPDRQQTIDTISGLLVWYRDILDEELIGAWQRDEARENLAAAMKPLADARIAAAVIEFSWRQQRQATFNLGFAPMFVDLMARSPDAANPFLDDLLAPNGSLNLSQTEADAVCRILLDLPDIRDWRKSALRILPRYRATTEDLLRQDMRSNDEEKRDLAQVWMADLGFDNRGPAPAQTARRRLQPSSTSGPTLGADSDRPSGGAAWPPPGAVDASRAPSSAPPGPAISTPAAAVSLPTPAPTQTTLVNAPPAASSGPTSGTLQCAGGAIPQNAEYVFRNVPLGKLQLDYDSKTWEARLTPGDGQSQRLILKNKSSGPQKRCSVRWSLIP